MTFASDSTFNQIIISLPHFTHLTTVFFASSLSNFFEPHIEHMGHALTFSILVCYRASKYRFLPPILRNSIYQRDENTHHL